MAEDNNFHRVIAKRADFIVEQMQKQTAKQPIDDKMSHQDLRLRMQSHVPLLTELQTLLLLFDQVN